MIPLPQVLMFSLTVYLLLISLLVLFVVFVRALRSIEWGFIITDMAVLLVCLTVFTALTVWQPFAYGWVA